MNATFHEQLQVVRTKLFGPMPKAKRVRRAKTTLIPVVPNNVAHMHVNSITITLVG
jgi:hypothetical protein